MSGWSRGAEMRHAPIWRVAMAEGYTGEFPLSLDGHEDFLTQLSGYSDGSLERITHENFVRVLGHVWR
jgi:hypothetical protein